MASKATQEADFSEFLTPPVKKFSDQELLEEVSRRGYVTHKDDPRLERHIELDAPKKGKIVLGIVSDTHLGSKYQQLTHWEHFARTVCKEAKIDLGIHCGDVVDGSVNMHKGIINEQFTMGFEGQGGYAARHYPEMRGSRNRIIEQKILGGNHDGSFFKDNGANIVRRIVEDRDELEFIGAPTATLHLSGVRLRLVHPSGGLSYARSYKPQRVVEQLAPENKPHIILFGHWHLPSHIPGYRNVEAITLPCFQAQTPYLAEKGLMPVIGGLILTIEFSERGLEDLTTRWVLYRTPIERDY